MSLEGTRTYEIISVIPKTNVIQHDGGGIIGLEYCAKLTGQSVDEISQQVGSDITITIDARNAIIACEITPPDSEESTICGQMF